MAEARTAKYRSVITAKMDIRVVNERGENLGKIEDVVINPTSGRIVYAALAVRDSFRNCTKYFSIPWSTLKFDFATGEAVLNLEKWLLNEDTGFDSENWPSIEEIEMDRWHTSGY